MAGGPSMERVDVVDKKGLKPRGVVSHLGPEEEIDPFSKGIRERETSLF